MMGSLQQVDDYNFMKDIYGDVVDLKRYQCFRFLEEVFELIQAIGILTKTDIDNLFYWVFERPAGKSSVELGDVQICLNVLGVVLHASVAKSRKEVVEGIKKRTPEQMRAKDNLKIKAGLI